MAAFDVTIKLDNNGGTHRANIVPLAFVERPPARAPYVKKGDYYYYDTQLKQVIGYPMSFNDQMAFENVAQVLWHGNEFKPGAGFTDYETTDISEPKMSVSNQTFCTQTIQGQLKNIPFYDRSLIGGDLEAPRASH